MDTIVAGVGMHPFGRFDGKSAVDMGVEAALDALDDAGLTWHDVDALYCTHMYAGTGAGHRIATALGGTGIPILNIENACSSGAAGVLMGRQAIEAAEHGTVLVVGVEKMPRGFMDMDYFDSWRQKVGHAVNPMQFAFAARRHMEDFGTTEHDFALVAEKNHRHSVDNPRAMYRREISADEVLASRPVVDPLRLLMLCAPNEGAAAAVLRSEEARPGDVRISGYGLQTAHHNQPIGEHMPTATTSDPSVEHVTARAAALAYDTAELGPDEIDVVELQDTDAASEIISSELLGVCQMGGGADLVASGASSLGGRLPINPSGGLLSKGEPVGASSLGQLFEIVEQLRGRCGTRQVEGARVGMTHSLGAGGNCAVLILQRT